MFIFLVRIIKYGFQSFVRNGLLSSATIAVMTLTLLLCAGLIIFGNAGKTVLANLQSKIDISIYFKNNVSENQILAIKKNLEKLDEVASVDYISQDDALATFKERHKDDPIILKSLEELGYNPLSASLNIKAKNPKSYEGIANYLEKEIPSEFIDKINYSQNQVIIERLTKIIDTVRNAGLILAAVLALIAFLVTFNTIRLAIYSNRESIGIMRLVGANSSLIRGPYIIQGFIISLASTILSMIVLIPVVYGVARYVNNFMPEFNIVHFYWSNFFYLFGIQFLVGLFLGIISSVIAIRKYLRV
jgi:cell division transport system permease protein